MQSKIRISQTAQTLLRCPICHAKIRQDGQQFICQNSACGEHFPIIDGIPILLNKGSSVFSVDDFAINQETNSNDDSGHGPKRAVKRLIPEIGRNIKGRTNYTQLKNLLLGQSSTPRVLVIGGRVLGDGMESLIGDPSFDFVETDVGIGPRTKLICDAHDIPFDDGSFDCVIAQAVLEHVLDPYRCVEEIHRVLNGNGIVYAETPFIQQVHGAPYDFTRFTYLGHRRLFRKFEEIYSGAVCGPGMALAWSYQYFMLSFATSKTMTALIRSFTALTSFYLKYFDSYLIDKPGTLDSASGYYFMGRKGERVLSDQELLKCYKGIAS